jgi:acyl-homoserine lactone acylase PvdQ
MVAGGGAVLGATLLGFRQLKLLHQQLKVTEQQATIADRQAGILAHQVEVDRAKLRADLFDRRLEVYQACKAYIRVALSYQVDDTKLLEASAVLASQLEQAEFLFAGEVRERLRTTIDEATELQAAREEVAELRRADPAADTPEATKLNETMNRVRQLRKHLRETLPSLADAMGEEMKLFIPRASAGAASAGS